MLSNSILAIIRTVVPGLVGSFLGLLASIGVRVDSDFEAALQTVLIGLFIAGYYALARWLEDNVHESFGWLLGHPGAPSYEANAKASGSVDSSDEEGAWFEDPEPIERID